MNHAAGCWMLLAIVALAVTAPDPAFAQRSTPVTIVDELLVEISAEPRSGVEPLEVFFSASVQGGTGILAYAWDFGDGSTSSFPADVHQYTTPGVHRAILTVIDDDGNAAQRFIDVQVDADLVPAVEIMPEDTFGIGSLTARFDSVVAGGNPPLDYSWKIDGQSRASTSSALLTFSSFATYTVELEVTDADGDTAVDIETVTVEEDREVVVDVTSTTTSGTAPLSVGFGAAALDGNAPFAFHWEFGQGSVSALQSPSFLFAQPGEYVVTVQATDANGDVGWASLVILVSPGP